MSLPARPGSGVVSGRPEQRSVGRCRTRVGRRAAHARPRESPAHRALREKNSATPQELDRAIAELRTAESAVRAAEARAAEVSASVTAAQAATRAAEVAASFSTIVAPFDGSITNRLLEPGNMAAPGVPLLTIETADGFRLEVHVDAARARGIDVGDVAAVNLDDFGADAITGRVVEVARAIDPASHAYVVKVELPPALPFVPAHLPAHASQPNSVRCWPCRSPRSCAEVSSHWCSWWTAPGVRACAP